MKEMKQLHRNQYKSWILRQLRILFVVNMKHHQHGPSKLSACCFKEWLISKKCIFLLHLQLFNKLWCTPKVSRIVYLNWCSAHTRALLLTIFLLRCSLRRAWGVHGSTIHLSQASPIHPDSKQALRELGNSPISASITPVQLITFPTSLPAALWPLFRSHYGHTSSHSQPKWRLHSYISRAHLASIIILHLSCACLPFWQGTSAQPFQMEKDETVSDVTSPTVQWWFALPLRMWEQ